MFLESNREELALMIRLVEERMRKEHPPTSDWSHERVPPPHTRERECWDRILHKLHGCECDVLA